MAVNSMASAVSLEFGPVSITLPEKSLIYLSIARMDVITPISKVSVKIT